MAKLKTKKWLIPRLSFNVKALKTLCKVTKIKIDISDIRPTCRKVIQKDFTSK